MTMDQTAFNAALKDYYTDDVVRDLCLKNRPFMAILSKEENFFGRKLPIPIIIGNPPNRSASFTQSQARAASTASTIRAFDLTRVKDYIMVNIDTETMESSESSEGAWFEARTNEIDGALNAMANGLESAAFRSGWGDIGRVGSFTGSTITLASLGDANNFEIGQEVVFADSQASSVLRDSGDSLIVSGVNRNSGVITFSTAVSNITGLANSDWVFIKGDRENSATPTRLRPAGFQAWVPSTAPSASESFFGVDRSVDSRLGGLRYDGSSDAIEDALIEGINRACSQGANPDYAFVDFQQYAKLTKNAHDLRRYVDVKVTADIGFEAFVIHGPKGPVKVIPDEFCPHTLGAIVQTNTWKLYSLKKAIRIIENDGLVAQRLPTSDGIEVRVGYKGNYGCIAPGWNMNVTLAE